MKNIEVLENFLNKKHGRTKNLNSVGSSLINYQTEIAYMKENVVFINSKKYSPTTSKITEQLKKLTLRKGLEVNFY